jgi:glyoxylase-like metal-dependent hydrolase (beta-lactamase superfamily II)
MRQIAPGLKMLPKTWGCNIYVIDEDPLTFIDAGFPLDARALKKYLRSVENRNPPTLVATHCHLDHMGSMARLKESFGARVYAHELDGPVMEGARPYTRFRLDPVRAAYYRLLGPLYPYEYVEVDVTVLEGDVIEAFGGLEVVHVPGHTEGSIALFQPERRMLFTGDTIRNENGVLDGPPPQFTADLGLAFEGIADKIMTLDFDMLLPGHGEPVVGGARDLVGALVKSRMEGSAH